MNIFWLYFNPKKCAQAHCDKHVVKMILESTQLLYTVHHFLQENDDWKSKTELKVYKPFNPKHPSCIWARESIENYRWLCRLAFELVKEWKFRYQISKNLPIKIHGCEPHLEFLRKNIPSGIPRVGLTYPRLAMDDKYKEPNGNVLDSYRRYYNKGKYTFAKYTSRSEPEWYKPNKYPIYSVKIFLIPF